MAAISSASNGMPHTTKPRATVSRTNWMARCYDAQRPRKQRGEPKMSNALATNIRAQEHPASASRGCYAFVPIPDHYHPPTPSWVLERRALLNRQIKSAMAGEKVKCGKCHRALRIVSVYKCLYCGVWFCARCAEQHFGMTRTAYHNLHPQHWLGGA